MNTVDQVLSERHSATKRLAHRVASGERLTSEEIARIDITDDDFRKLVKRQENVIAFHRLTKEIAETEADCARLLRQLTDAKIAAENRDASEKDRPALVVKFEQAVEAYQGQLFLLRALNESLRDAERFVQQFDNPNPVRRFAGAGANGQR
jgi:hypothetical protein